MPSRPSVCRVLESSVTSAVTTCAPVATRMASTNTVVEWPMANQKPTDFGRRPSAISLRVVLSMAAMWSASTPWRRP